MMAAKRLQNNKSAFSDKIKDEIIKASLQEMMPVSLPRVPYGTKCHYMLNIWSIFTKFEQQKGLGQICHLKA